MVSAGAMDMTGSDVDFGLLAGDGIATRSAKAGEIIFKEGDDADQLFVIKSGQVRIQLGNRTLSELSANNIFGEMALIDDAPRSATAVAITDVELVPIAEKQFLFLVGQTPFFALKLMRVLAGRLRATNKTFG
jgi:CRP/FNR family transcriptional regulator, cyclic AMP receptor protein